MKSLSDVLHRTPWWVLLGGGVAVFVALAVMVTPIHLIGLQHAGATPQENRAIKKEIESTFAEGAIDVGQRVLTRMREHTQDPAQREEIERNLRELENARAKLDDAADAARDARGDAASAASGAWGEAHRAIEEATRETERALAETRKLDENAGKAAPPSGTAAPVPSAPPASVTSPPANVPPAAIAPPPSPDERPSPAAPDDSGDVTVKVHPLGSDAVEIQMGPSASEDRAAAALPPDLRARIRRNVASDLYRMGVGGALILIFIPLFILTVVAKIFIDRSRVAQRVAESERREAEYQRMSRQVTEAKLSALQAQVEPHFLYNTLANVQALTEVDPRRANEMTGHLIQYLRNALPKMRESLSTVGQEVELVRAYLNILQMRMGERLAFEIYVAPGLESAPFPPLMLPSLVENAIKHGLEPQREGGRVAIRAEALDGILRVTVADTGRGLSDAPGQGVGLANIRERLAALYGDHARLVIEANEPHGVRATLEVAREAPEVAPASPSPSAPPLRAQRTVAARAIAVAGNAERAWRKGLSFAFIVLVAIAAVAAGLAIVGILAGELHVKIGEGYITGAPGALIGAVGVSVAFIVAVLALAIVVAVVYGLGFLFVGLAIFIPIMVLVSIFPALAPFVLVGLFVWWLVRRAGRSAAPPGSAKPRGP